MKIAIVHDQLREFGGAERVLVALKHMYPEADVFTSFYTPHTLGMHADQFKDWNIITSWAAKVPLLQRLYSPFRFLGPWIWESFDFSGYDVVLTSSATYMCKGVVTRPDTPNICYLHHPPRYLYYYETAVEWQKYWPVRVYGHLINHNLRIWDYISSQRVDYFILNSEETRRRVQKVYRCDGVVIYPPVDIPEEVPIYQSPKEPYFVTTSRLARAKHVDVLIHAANKGKFHLKIIGKGRDEEYLRSIAGDTVEFLSGVTDEAFRDIYAGARAFLFASVDEEFGIAPVEAMGHGVPVVAYASGGLKETVQNGKNGFLYHALDSSSLLKSLEQLDSLSEQAYINMRTQARALSLQYSVSSFKEKIQKVVSKEVPSHS